MSLEQELFDLPERIKQQEQTVLEVADKMEDLTSDLARLEVQVKLDVAAARDDSNKPLFSNETSRAAETSRRLAEDRLYSETASGLAVLKRQKAFAEIQLRLLQNQLRVRLAIISARKEVL